MANTRKRSIKSEMKDEKNPRISVLAETVASSPRNSWKRTKNYNAQYRY